MLERDVALGGIVGCIGQAFWSPFFSAYPDAAGEPLRASEQIGTVDARLVGSPLGARAREYSRRRLAKLQRHPLPVAKDHPAHLRHRLRGEEHLNRR